MDADTRKLKESARAQVQVEYSKVNKIITRILCEIFRETGFYEKRVMHEEIIVVRSIITEIAIILFSRWKK